MPCKHGATLYCFAGCGVEGTKKWVDSNPPTIDVKACPHGLYIWCPEGCHDDRKTD